MAKVTVEASKDDRVVVLSISEWARIIGLLASFAQTMELSQQAMEMLQVKNTSQLSRTIKDLLKPLQAAVSPQSQ
ncbi:MAG: hypothetical protein E3J67_01875 [Dehalococcoidia bacterium]|nr:MAG: hypothetical protein E3J67_01875 [Dehalococcoidia bacterium]